jgi:Plasma-membrane choline transporter
MATPYYNASSGTAPVIVQGHAVVAPSYASSPYHHHSVTPVVMATTTEHSYAATKDPVGTCTARPQPVQHGCRDAFWGFLFYVHLGVMAVLAVVYSPQAFASASESYQNGGQGRRQLDDAADYTDNGNDNSGSNEISVDPVALLTVLAASGLVGGVVSSLALAFMMNFAEGLVKVALVFNVAVFGAVALVSLAAGAIPGAVLGGVGCAMAAYYAYCVWSRIPFAAANLVTAVTAVRANMGLALYAYVSLLLLVGWSFWWTVSSVSTIMVLGDCAANEDCSSAVNGIVIFLFLISYYWTIQVITNVVYVYFAFATFASLLLPLTTL